MSAAVGAGRPAPPGLQTDRLAGWIPCLAVAVGLHRLGSAWAAIGIYHALALLYLLLDRRGLSWRSLRQGWRLRPGLVLGGLGLLTGAVILWVQPSAALPGHTLRWRLEQVGLSSGSWLPFGLYFLVVTPALEEVFWRGRLAGASRWPDRSDLLFAVYHGLVLLKFWKPQFAGAAVLVLLAAGWTLRQVRLRTDGLAVPFAAHLAADLGVLAGVIAAGV